MTQLAIRVLGDTQVMRDGQPAVWHARAAQDLFYYLLSHPEGRAKEELLEVLWSHPPDASGFNRFRVTIHRVRSALGMPDAVHEKHGRYRLAPKVFQASDLHTFYATIDEAERTHDPAAKITAYQRALDAYKGDYLPGYTVQWVLTAREEHRAAYVRAAIELSLLHCDAGSCEAGVAALTLALRADPFIGENYHQRLIACLAAVEGKYAATEHYRRFLKFLRDELGEAPLDETRTLAARIRAGELPGCDTVGAPPPHRFTCPLTPDGRCKKELRQALTLPEAGR